MNGARLKQRSGAIFHVYQKQVVYVAIANPTKRKLIRLLADVEELYDY